MKRNIGNKEPQTVPATVNDQWNFLLSTIWDQMIHLVIRFDGFLDDAGLQCAVDRALQTEPLLRMRFVEDERPYFTLADRRVQVFSVIETDRPDHILHQVLSDPLDPVTGPMARVRLIRSSHDLLIISMNHTITDAYGVKIFGSSVARHYRAGKNGYLPLKNHHDRSFASVLGLFTVKEREEAWSKYGKQEMCPSKAEYYGRGNPQYRLVTICPGTFIALKEKAARLGVTVNDIVLSAYIHAMGKYVPEMPGCERSVLTSMDLRRYLSPDSFPSLANLSVAFEVPFPNIPARSLSRMVRYVHTAMIERKDGHAGIGIAERICRDFSSGFPAVREHLRLMAQETRNGYIPKRPFFSNMGVLPEGVLAFGQPGVTEAFLLPPVEYPPGLGIAACTSQSSLILSSGFCAESLPAEWVTGVLEKMNDDITHFVE
jgi:NRPS condensation-like uncharacterized protein